MKSAKIFVSFIILLGIFLFSPFIKAQNINEVEVYFCQKSGENINYQKSITYNVNAGETKNICIMLKNNSNKDIDLALGFVDATYTNDNLQHPACKNEGDSKQIKDFFGKTKEEINIPAGATIEKYFQIKIPYKTPGEYNGCVTAYINQTKNTGQMLNVLVRKARFITFILTGDIPNSGGVTFVEAPIPSDVSTISSNPKIIVYTQNLSGKKEFSIIKIQNKSPINQQVKITGYLKPFLGKQVVFLTQERKITPYETMTLKKQLPMPFYKGPAKISYELNYSPISINNLNGEDFTSTNIFVFSLRLILPILLILLILLGIYYKKRK